MLKKGDVIGYSKKNDFRSVVLEEILKMISKKGFVQVVELKLGTGTRLIGSEPDIRQGSSLRKSVKVITNSKTEKSAKGDFGAGITRATLERGKFKFATPLTTDIQAYEIIDKIINRNINDLKKKDKKTITPLCLFLDKEVLLYAKLKKLKFKKTKTPETKISKFIDDLEKKHPEVKQAIVKGILDLK